MKALQRKGYHDVSIVPPQDRRLSIEIDAVTEQVKHVEIPEDTEVVVFQRITHRWLTNVVPYLRSKGIAVVIDVDDDLSAIDPNNAAWDSLHPTRQKTEGVQDSKGNPYRHSWNNLVTACRYATMVTATTPELLRRYAPHGRGRLLPNYLSRLYDNVSHEDSDIIGWPAAIQSHPNDPYVVGPAIARLVDEGADFRVISYPVGAGRAFGLAHDPPGEVVPLAEWPQALATLGIGIAPLADTRFNASKSWLKILEMSACGVPWVASPRVEYQRLHAIGCGILVDRPKDWYRTLRDLRKSAGWRAELSEAGRSVASGLRLEDHAWKWWEAWEDALTLQRKTPVESRQ